MRVSRRIQILKLLDKGSDLTAAGEAVDTYAREVRRVGWRYLEKGLEAALTDDARPKPSKRLDARQEGRSRGFGMWARRRPKPSM